MEILSLLSLGSGPSAPEATEEETQQNLLSDNGFRDAVATAVQPSNTRAQENIAGQRPAPPASADPIVVRQLGAHIALVSALPANADQLLTVEDVEQLIAQIIEEQELNIELSVLDRERIVQAILSAQEEAEEGEANLLAADTDNSEGDPLLSPVLSLAVNADLDSEEEQEAEGLFSLIRPLDAQDEAQGRGDEVDFLPLENNEQATSLLENDQALVLDPQAVPIEAPLVVAPAQASEIVFTVQAAPATPVVLNPFSNVADSGIRDALQRTRAAFDALAQVIVPRQNATSATPLEAGGFAATDLLSTLQPGTQQAANSLQGLESSLRQGVDLGELVRENAVRAISEQISSPNAGNANGNAPRSAVTATQQQIRNTLDAPEVIAERATQNVAQATATQGNAGNVIQQSSPELLESANQQGSDRAHTVRPGAQAGNAADQVNVGIRQGAANGLDRVVIQLDPAELGRVEVRLDVQDGRASVVVTAESRDTLDALQRDARGLERALAEAGLDSSGSDLQFNLGGEGGQGDGDSEGDIGTGFADADEEVSTEQALLDADANYTLNVEDGLNIRV